MSRSSRCLLTVLVIVAATMPLRAQSAVDDPLIRHEPGITTIVGVAAGPQISWFNGHSTIVLSTRDTVFGPVNVNVDGRSGWGISAGADVSLLLSEDLQLGARVTFDRRSAERSQTIPEAVVLDPQTNEVRHMSSTLRTEFAVDVLATQVTLGVTVACFGDAWINLVGGFEHDLTLSTRVRRTLESTEAVNSVGGFPTEDNGHRIVFYDDVMPDAASAVFAAVVGADLQYSPTGAWGIGLNARYGAPLTGLTPDMHVSTMRLAATISILL